MRGRASHGRGFRLARAGAALLLAAAVLGCGASVSPPAMPTATLALDDLVATVRPAAPERPLVVNFWATWCAPCVAELPELAEVAAEHADDVRVLAVSLDLAMPYSEGVESADDVAAFLARRGIALELIVFDGAAEDLNARLDLPGPLPFTYALDRAGRRVDTIGGGADRARFEALFAAALR